MFKNSMQPTDTKKLMRFVFLSAPKSQHVNFFVTNYLYLIYNSVWSKTKPCNLASGQKGVLDQRPPSHLV